MRGLERGIERAIGPVETTAIVEIEAFVIENLVQQMEQGLLAPAPVWSDLKTFPSKSFYGKVHGITGGYPCQPFSVAGNRGGKQDPRHLWPYIGGGANSIVGTIRPIWCFFENVPGHLELGYREVKSDLESLGYTVEEGIFSAEEVGAPHLRKRLFILAVENSARERWRRGSDVSKDGGRTLQTERPRTLADTQSREDNRRESRELGEKKSSRGCDATTTRTSREVGDSTAQRLQESGQGRLGEFSAQEGRRLDDRSQQPSDAELADSNHDGERARPRKIESPSEEIESAQQREERNQEERERMRSKSGNESPGGELANTTTVGMEGLGSSGEQESNPHERSGLPVREGRRDRWPAKPNEPQYDWEAPRIESVMGYSINGYNFREDLLRMAGNGVVEQTAEVAFRELLKKHGIEI
jgi:DNA (cytosine-5)-methyltransferase 1